MTPLYHAVFPTGISRKTWFSRKKPVAGIAVVFSVCICSSMAMARGFGLCPLYSDVFCRAFSDIASFSIPATALPSTRPRPDRSARTAKRRPIRRVQTGYSSPPPPSSRIVDAGENSQPYTKGQSFMILLKLSPIFFEANRESAACCTPYTALIRLCPMPVSACFAKKSERKFSMSMDCSL